jgi:hypothetical protein
MAKKQKLTVKVPPIAVSVRNTDGCSGTSFYDTLLVIRADSKYSLAEKLRDLASLIGSSDNLLSSGTVMIGCRRR